MESDGMPKTTVDTINHINLPSLPSTPISSPSPHLTAALGTPISLTHISHGGPASPASVTQRRRSSNRSIKRKKFDDELVESSLLKSNARQPHHSKGGLMSPFMPPVTNISGGTSAVGVPVGSLSASGSPVATTQPPIPSSTNMTGYDYHTMTEYATSSITSEKKKVVSSKSTKRIKRQKNQSMSAKDLGRWKPTDDLLLIEAVQQTNDLQLVHRGVKFSCKFTLQEIQERWYSLLYDPVISKMAVAGMKQLHPEVITSVKSKALFSKQEEKLIIKVLSSEHGNLEKFQDVLDNHPDVFYPSRTAKSLYNHWVLMKQYHLLPDQSVQPLPQGEDILNFSDGENFINDSELLDNKDEIVEHEMALMDRKMKKEIRLLENEIPKWKVNIENITGITTSDLDNHTLAVLRGRLVRYLMRSREITLGRQAKNNVVDVDLSLEGPASKISRKQGVIKMDANGEFFIANEGKRPIFVDGKPVLMGNKHKLNHDSVVEISCLRFIFLMNQELVDVIKTE